MMPGVLQMLMGGVKGPLPLLCLQALHAALASTPSAVWEPMLAEVCMLALNHATIALCHMLERGCAQTWPRCVWLPGSHQGALLLSKQRIIISRLE